MWHSTGHKTYFSGQKPLVENTQGLKDTGKISLSQMLIYIYVLQLQFYEHRWEHSSELKLDIPISTGLSLYKACNSTF